MKYLILIVFVFSFEIVSFSNGELTIEGSLEWNGNGFNNDAIQVNI